MIEKCDVTNCNSLLGCCNLQPINAMYFRLVSAQFELPSSVIAELLMDTCSVPERLVDSVFDESMRFSLIFLQMKHLSCFFNEAFLLLSLHENMHTSDCLFKFIKGLFTYCQNLHWNISKISILLTIIKYLWLLL